MADTKRQRMRTRWTFFHVLSLLWVGVNITILVVTASGWRDLSGMTFTLSFPVSIVVGMIYVIALDLFGWSTTSAVALLFGIVTTVTGYVQWFVLGRALAEKLVARIRVPRRLRATLWAAVVSMFLGLGAIGCEIVRADEQAGRFIDRASDIPAAQGAGAVGQRPERQPEAADAETAAPQHLTGGRRSLASAARDGLFVADHVLLLPHSAVDDERHAVRHQLGVETAAPPRTPWSKVGASLFEGRRRRHRPVATEGWTWPLLPPAVARVTFIQARRGCRGSRCARRPRPPHPRRG
jgi:hypothetical protein